MATFAKELALRAESRHGVTKAVVNAAKLYQDDPDARGIVMYDLVAENGLPSKWFVVVDANDEPCGAFNDSFPCPPFCPPD